jgi:hypothetical protein
MYRQRMTRNLHLGVMVVRLDPLQLEINPVVLDQSLDGSSTGKSDSLPLLIKRSLDVVLDLLGLVLGSSDGLVGVGGKSGGTCLSFIFHVMGGILCSSKGLVLVGGDGGLGSYQEWVTKSEP